MKFMTEQKMMYYRMYPGCHIGPHPHSLLPNNEIIRMSQTTCIYAYIIWRGTSCPISAEDAPFCVLMYLLLYLECWGVGWWRSQDEWRRGKSSNWLYCYRNRNLKFLLEVGFCYSVPSAKTENRGGEKADFVSNEWEKYYSCESTYDTILLA